MIITHVVISLKPEMEKECLEAMNSLAKETRLESGSISYDFYKSIEKEHTYILVEVWRDQTAVDAHNTSEHFKSFMSESEEKGYSVSQKVAVFNAEQIVG